MGLSTMRLKKEDKVDNTELNCLICRSTDVKELTLLDDGFKLVKCRVCEFVFAIPRPGIEELIKYYNIPYYTPHLLTRKKARSSTKNLYKFIRHYNPNAKNVLDIGCASGHTLYGLRQWGLEVTGTDISSSACEYASKCYNLNLYNSEFPPDELFGYFDVLILSHVVEHLIDPITFLKKASNYVKDGGMFFISTPSIDCILFNLFGRNFREITPPGHINFFNPKSIKKLLTESGFESIRVYTQNPVWGKDNFFTNVLFSALRSFGLLQIVKRKLGLSAKCMLNCTPSCHGEIMRKSRFLQKIKLLVDYFTTLLSLMGYPILKAIENNDKGLFLFVISFKKGTSL
jgi:2-polyprenyl-3-methyl-5-hydroxy-6-metoxy-1,4-benzoquinol methylase